jgi:DNA-binding transcriptional LysR family regulator
MALAEHLEKLRYFQRVVNFNSIREASKAIGISQAGLSKNLSSLEEVLGTKLFVRSREGLTLTKEGQEVLNSTFRILAESSMLEVKLRSLKSSSAPSRLRIGMYDSIAVYFFAELKAYLKQLYPELRLELTVDRSAALAKAVSGGDLDLAIGVNLHCNKRPGLEFVKLFDDRYGFYLPNRDHVNIANLPFLIHPGAEDFSGVSVETHLKSLTLKRDVHRIYNFETLKILAVQGIGIGVLPTQVAKPLIKKASLVSVEIPKMHRLFGVHNIGFLATRSLLNSHRAFAEDIYRLGERWSKS